MNVSIKQHKRHILEDISSHTTNMTSLAMYRVHCGGGGCCGPESNHAISIYHFSKLNCDNSENQAPRHVLYISDICKNQATRHANLK